MARLEINGRIVEVDDGFLSMSPEDQNATVDEIAQSLGGASPEVKPPAATATPMTPAPVTPAAAQSAPAAPQQSFGDSFVEGAGKGTQAVAEGFAQLYGLPVDLINTVINGVAATGNLGVRVAESNLGMLGLPTDIPEIPYANIPGGGKDQVQNFRNIVGGAGVPLYDPETDFTEAEQLLYMIDSFGAQALAGGVGSARAATTKLAEEGPAVVQAALRPYTKGNPGRVVVGDTIGGAGAGTGLHALDEYASDAWKNNPLVRTLAALGGGVGAASIGSAIGAPVSVVKSVFDNIMPDTNVAMPKGEVKSILGAEAEAMPTRRDAQEAARFQQGQASNPQLAAQNIAESQQTVRQMGGPSPTTAMMSDDVGLRRQERGFRAVEGKPFEDLDVRNRNAAYDDLHALRPEGADPALPGLRAEDEIKRLLEQADAAVGGAQQQADTALGAEKELADIYAQFSGLQGPASEALDDAVVGQTLKPMQAFKNELYGAIDPDASTYVPAIELQRIIGDMEDASAMLGPNAQSQKLPRDLIDDLRAMMTTEDTDIPTIPYRSLNEMRPLMSEQINAARKSGQFQKADNVKALKGTIDTATEDLAKTGGAAGGRAMEAEDFYKSEFAPRFNQGEGKRFRRDINADDKHRTSTPPTKTAGRFLTSGPGSKEKAADLQRILKESPGEAAGKKAVRDYIMADMSKVVVNGKVNPTRLEQWQAQNEGMLSQFPDIAQEVNGVLAEARGRGAKSSAMKAELETAIKGQKQTERELADSAFAKLAGAAPDRAVGDIMGSRNPAAAVDQVTKLVGKDPAAKRGFQAAVADYLIKQFETTDVTGVSGERAGVSLAKVSKTFKQHEAVLEKVFGDDVRYLRQVRQRLEMLSKRGGSATTGSPTIENANLASKAMGTAEILIRLKFGALRGGSEMRKIKLLTDKLPNIHNGANRLIWRAQFDPEVAKYLLTKPLTPENLPQWSKWLRRTLAVGAGAQGDDSEE